VVKQINIFLDDVEHEKIKKVKGNMTWIDFIMHAAELIEKEQKEKKSKEKK